MSKAVWIALLTGVLSITPALALEITSVVPARATPGTPVVLTGGIFSPQSRIYLGEQFVVPVQLLPRELSFIAPELPPGSYSLTVQDDVASASQPFTFEILVSRPQIAAVVPDNLNVCTDETERLVQIKGENFHPEAKLLFGGAVVTSRTIDASTMEFRLPELPAGVYGVEVQNPDGTASLPHSLWVNSVPEISAVERGSEFVNNFEVIIRGKNFLSNSILVVRETNDFTGGNAPQRIYYAHRRASVAALSSIPAQGEQLRYDDCRTLVYLRYPSNFQDKELTLQVINPDGKKTAPYAVTLP